MTEDTIALRLARKIRAVTYDDLSPLAKTRAQIGIVDTIGVTLAGAAEDSVAILRRTPGVGEAEGPSALMGQADRVSMLDAALINGTASHALDYDDFSSVFGGHQSVPLVAPLFALAEAEGKTGKDFIAAYAAGVEAELRLSRAVHWHHYDKGWHPTATLGVIAAAGACAQLMGLDEDGIATALCIAVSQSSGVKANFGSMTKPLHVGEACRAGLLSALLAREGFTASDTAFEHGQGFFDVFNGEGNYDPAKLFDNWASPWELEGGGLALKLWPCCGSTHAAIAAALDLRKAEALKADDIVRIEILPHERRLRHTDTPNPVTPLQGKFSVQYVVARALADGAVTLAHFTPEAVTEPRIAELLKKVEARGHPDLGDAAEGQWAAEVIVHTTDGRTLSQRVDDFTSDPRVMPDRVDELESKFEDCAKLVLNEDDIFLLFERLETFASVTDMTALGRMLLARRKLAPSEKISAATGEDADRLAETHWVP